MNTPTKSDTSAIKPGAPADLLLNPNALAAEKQALADLHTRSHREEAWRAKSLELQALAIMTRRKLFDGKNARRSRGGGAHLYR